MPTDYQPTEANLDETLEHSERYVGRIRRLLYTASGHTGLLQAATGLRWEARMLYGRALCILKSQGLELKALATSADVSVESVRKVMEEYGRRARDAERERDAAAQQQELQTLLGDSDCIPHMAGLDASTSALYAIGVRVNQLYYNLPNLDAAFKQRNQARNALEAHVVQWLAHGSDAKEILSALTWGYKQLRDGVKGMSWPELLSSHDGNWEKVLLHLCRTKKVKPQWACVVTVVLAAIVEPSKP